MFSFRRWLFCVALAMGSRMAAQPALTTIQDILYTADGNRFNGLMTITWQSFEAGDTSNIAGQVTRLNISNGNLYVQLVPTTTADTPATYAVQYNSNGHTQFNEVWVVFPECLTLARPRCPSEPGRRKYLGPASANGERADQRCPGAASGVESTSHPRNRLRPCANRRNQRIGCN